MLLLPVRGPRALLRDLAGLYRRVHGGFAYDPATLVLRVVTEPAEPDPASPANNAHGIYADMMQFGFCMCVFGKGASVVGVVLFVCVCLCV